jgi:hypothetical protein
VPWLRGEGRTGRAWEEVDAAAGVVLVDVELREVAVDAEGRGEVELLDEEDVVR